MAGLDAHVGGGADGATVRGVHDRVELGIARALSFLRPFLVVREIRVRAVKQVCPALAIAIRALGLEDLARVPPGIERLEATVAAGEHRVCWKRRCFPVRQRESNRLAKFVEAMGVVGGRFHGVILASAPRRDEGPVRRTVAIQLARTKRRSAECPQTRGSRAEQTLGNSCTAVFVPWRPSWSPPPPLPRLPPPTTRASSPPKRCGRSSGSATRRSRPMGQPRSCR